MVKKLTIIKITDTSDIVKKLTVTQTRVGEIEKKILDNNHNKFITTQEFDKLKFKNFDARLKKQI